MAPRSASPAIPTGTSPATPRRRARRRRMPITSRSGAATGTGSSAMTATTAGVSYDGLSAHIRGTVEGFALAHNITSQQAFTQLKKSLVW